MKSLNMHEVWRSEQWSIKSVQWWGRIPGEDFSSMEYLTVCPGQARDRTVSIGGLSLLALSLHHFMRWRLYISPVPPCMFFYFCSFYHCRITFHSVAFAVVLNWSNLSWTFSNCSYHQPSHRRVMNPNMLQMHFAIRIVLCVLTFVTRKLHVVCGLFTYRNTALLSQMYIFCVTARLDILMASYAFKHAS